MYLVVIINEILLFIYFIAVINAIFKYRDDIVVIIIILIGPTYMVAVTGTIVP